MFSNTVGVDFVEVTDDQVNVDFSPFPYIYNLLEGGPGDDQMAKTFTLVLSVGSEVSASIDPASDTATITISCKPWDILSLLSAMGSIILAEEYPEFSSHAHLLKYHPLFIVGKRELLKG